MSSYKRFKKNLKQDIFREIENNPFLKLKEIELDNFGKVSYFDIGEGPISLLIHGIGETPLSYKNLLIKHSANNRVVAPFLPGYGLSWFNNKLAKNLGSFNYLDVFLNKFIDKLALQSFQVIGKDIGASIGINLALGKTSSKLDKLIIINPVVEPMKFLSIKGFIFNLKSQINFFETSLKFYRNKQTYNLKKTFLHQIFLNEVLSEINFIGKLQNVKVPIDLYYIQNGFINTEKVISIFNKYLPTIPAVPYTQAKVL